MEHLCLGRHSSSSICWRSGCFQPQHNGIRRRPTGTSTQAARQDHTCDGYPQHECLWVLRPLQATIQPPADPYALPAPTGHKPKSITVYQYEVCPFCCKVKTFLDYNKVSTAPAGP